MKNPFLALSFVLLVANIHSPCAFCASWNRSEFLGAKAHSSEVEGYVKMATSNRSTVEQLAKIRSPEALTALLRIAYSADGDRFSPTMSLEAAQRYLIALDDKSRARALLVASNADVVVAGLTALIGQQIDSDLLLKLSELALSESCDIRRSVAFILRDDKGTILDMEKVKILLPSMRSVLACTNAGRLLGFGNNVFHTNQTAAELCLTIQSAALGQVKNLPGGSSETEGLPEMGLAREFVVLGFVQSGYEKHREEARQILKTSKSLPARLRALHVLMWAPRDEDLAAVKWVAENDDFRAVAMYGYFQMPGADLSMRDKPDRERAVYIVRFLAEVELRRFESRRRP